MLEIRELTAGSIIMRILAAVVLGGIIGLERGRKNRPAGLRTYMLVCIGACVVMILNQYVYQVYKAGDPVRMGAQVISGIGFLGAGTIMVTAHNQIKGLTTAAGLWTAACIGLAIGIGLYEAAIVAGAAVVFVLTALNRWDYSVRHSHCYADVYMELEHDTILGNILRDARDQDIEISNIQIIRVSQYMNEPIDLTATLKGLKKCEHELLIVTVRKLKGVLYVAEL